MNILALETSCDETAAAIVKDGRTILSSVVATQIPLHKPYSGVVPEIASREHLLTINRVIAATLEKAKFKKDLSDVDSIAVTVGPGLVGSLLVGRMTAETLGWVHNVPVVGVNHIEGHLLSPLLNDANVKPPFLGLVVSGGHTELIYAPKWGNYFLVGRTRDDAAGEAFDKVAKMMDLGYPGGPIIDKLAAGYRATKNSKHAFPRPWLPGTWDFSFSGIKTAVLYRLREKKSTSLAQKKVICAEFQEAVAQVLAHKSVAAARALKVNRLVVGGGVAANSRLRGLLTELTKKNDLELSIAPLALCTDNAAMIASSAYFKIRTGRARKPDLTIRPQLHVPFFDKKLPPFTL